MAGGPTLPRPGLVAQRRGGGSGDGAATARDLTGELTVGEAREVAGKEAGPDGVGVGGGAEVTADHGEVRESTATRSSSGRRAISQAAASSSSMDPAMAAGELTSRGPSSPPRSPRRPAARGWGEAARRRATREQIATVPESVSASASAARGGDPGNGDLGKSASASTARGGDPGDGEPGKSASASAAGGGDPSDGEPGKSTFTGRSRAAAVALLYDADAESRAVSQGALDMPAWPMAATSTLSVASGKSIGNQVYNVEWTNSTSYYFNSTSCPATHQHPATRAHDCLADGRLSRLDSNPTSLASLHHYVKSDILLKGN
uniref:Uncharacterized protein n=2 Tax=Oryza sativa subsp. japonica TaxID=39947 RepID=Q6Z0F4_ORYSJ|nr:hypothetical protein [Oryza sativa Japonica Group]BAD03652.1 hypothetical protein [Oryza sativa Japonica Group]